MRVGELAECPLCNLVALSLLQVVFTRFMMFESFRVSGKRDNKTGPLHIRFRPVASSYQVSIGQNISIDGGSKILSPKSDTTCIFTVFNVEGCLYVLGFFGHKIIPPFYRFLG